MTTAVDTYIDEKFADTKRMADWWAVNREHYVPLVTALTNLGAEVRPSYSGLDVTWTGGKRELTALFRVMRMHGFAPITRPQAKETYYSAFFYPEGKDIQAVWVSFSSNVCKRVQVGTKYEEVPVYEVQCSESMELPEENIND